MNPLMYAVGLAALLSLCAATTTNAAESIRGTVEQVSDGDTLRVDGRRICLCGIDAPEIKQTCKDGSDQTYACSTKSRLALEFLVAAKDVECRVRDTDRYGRAAAQCSVGGADIGALLVVTGQAVAYTRFTDFYLPHQHEAQVAGRGVWAGPFQMPWEWRETQRPSPP